MQQKLKLVNNVNKVTHNTKYHMHSHVGNVPFLLQMKVVDQPPESKRTEHLEMRDSLGQVSWFSSVN